MQFEPILEGYIFYLVVSALLLICFAQVTYFFFQNTKRKTFKSLLYSFFTIVLLMYIVQPFWEKELPEQTALLIPSNSKKEDFGNIAKELGVDKILYAGEKIGAANRVKLYGQDYTKEDLLAIPMVDLDWTPNTNAERYFEAVNWKGILRYGQRQHLKGKLFGAAGKLQVKLSEEVLASQELNQEGMVDLHFPALILGENELGIFIDNEKVGEMRFYVEEAEALDVEIKVGFPNPESRVLRDYLIKRGDRSNQSIQVSKDSRIVSEVENGRKPILFIDPSQLVNLNAADIGTVYSGLFLFNLSNPEQDIFNLNRKLNTGFELNKVGDISLEVEQGVNVFPYEFLLRNNQDSLFSSAFEIMDGYSVGVGLMESSYELQFAGDSLAYAKIWEPILEQLSPMDQSFHFITYPIFQGQSTALYYYTDSLEEIELEKNWVRDPINDGLFKFQFISDQEGWQETEEGIKIYVESSGDFTSVYKNSLMFEFLKERRSLSEELRSQAKAKEFVPDWLWFLLLLFTLSLIWIEPRFRS
ncbi:MAG: hypothetical protein EA341_12300 [Mongoliibacter sp.]|nr:MAG: hypothetical protein EA341_12300 [Mongoliibacter sp.]